MTGVEINLEIYYDLQYISMVVLACTGAVALVFEALQVKVAC